MFLGSIVGVLSAAAFMVMFFVGAMVRLLDRYGMNRKKVAVVSFRVIRTLTTVGWRWCVDCLMPPLPHDTRALLLKITNVVGWDVPCWYWFRCQCNCIPSRVVARQGRLL